MLTFCKWQRVYLQTALLMVSRQKLLLYDVHRTKKWIASSLLYASCSKQFIHVNTALGILQGKGLIYNTLMRSLITRHQRHGVPQLEPTGNVHSRPKRCGKWLSEPLNFLVANYKKSISACFKRGNVAWIGHSMNGLKTRQIHIHHYHWLMFLRMTSASKFRAVLDAGCHAIRQGDARNTPFCYLGHSSDKFKWHFLVHKKYVGTKKKEKLCGVFKNLNFNGLSCGGNFCFSLQNRPLRCWTTLCNYEFVRCCFIRHSIDSITEI